MSRRYRQLIESQAKVKVAAHTHDLTTDQVWFITLAATFAGVFYFFGYYFGGDLWRALVGG